MGRHTDRDYGSVLDMSTPTTLTSAIPMQRTTITPADLPPLPPITSTSTSPRTATPMGLKASMSRAKAVVRR